MTIASHKVVFVGDSAVGKTAIIHQYIYGNAAAQHEPTIGIDFFAKTIKNPGQTLRLQIWDTAGQEKFHALIPSYIRNSTVVVLVYDINSQASFESLDRWYKMVLDLADPIVVVVGNKFDLQASRQVSAEDGRKFADDHNAQFFETSAITGDNITSVFEAIAKIPRAASEIPTPVALPEPTSAGTSTGSSCC
jgi:small GTP-binding protein